MLQVNQGQEPTKPMCTGDVDKNDAPEGLRRLSDLMKAQAVAAGVANAVGVNFEAQLEKVQYGAFDRTREFRRPAELKVMLRPVETDNCDGVRVVGDVELEESVARSLSLAAGEPYRVRLADKYYPPYAPSSAVRLAVLVARV